MILELDSSDIRIQTLRQAVLAALDAAAVELYGQENMGWRDEDLPRLFRAVNEQANRILDRVAEGKV